MRPNAEEYFTSDWTCDGSNAFANWCNEEFDQIVAEAEQTFDYEERLALNRQAEDMFIEEVAGASLGYPPFIHGTNTRVQNYSIHPAGELRFRWLWLQP
jgi:dipeptide transport system substrate-binding protein